ncbi:MAG: DUF4058 family protein [Caldilineaceae bacterium]|nr:DUF4058 family protein [Caldilineaceae bacterium]
MPSPFPGMDPFLEGYLWPDVHHSLATQIRDQLSPLIRPHYVARIEVQVVRDETPEAEIGIMYPDVELLRRQALDHASLAPTNGGPSATAALTPATITVELLAPEVRLASVHILDAAQNQLITSIEILSPVNKREPGLTQYREKWRQLRNAGVHLIEIDLLRRGQRTLADPRIPTSAYRISLTRAEARKMDVWTLSVTDKLPIIPVPLRKPDTDVSLNLGAAFATIYDRAGYDLSIDYSSAPPPPLFSEKDQESIAAILKG